MIEEKRKYLYYLLDVLNKFDNSPMESIRDAIYKGNFNYDEDTLYSKLINRGYKPLTLKEFIRNGKILEILD